MQVKRKGHLMFSYKMVGSAMLLAFAIISVMAINRMTSKPLPPNTNIDVWIPTEEDMKSIDSLYNQVKDIEEDVEELAAVKLVIAFDVLP